MLGSLALSLVIGLAWLGEPAAGEGGESTARAGAEGYAAALAEVERLDQAVNRDPETHYQALADALSQLSQYADELARDDAARRMRTLAQLNLARALLAAGDDERAGSVVDEAIRSAGDGEVPAGNFGPKFASFHNKRREALVGWGSGSIAVECSVPCRVIIDEHAAEPTSAGLLFGEYRVWVFAEDPAALADGSPLRQRVTIDIDGEVETIRYEPAAKPPEHEPEPPPRPPPPPPKRLLPRWAEIVGLVAGVGLIATGGALLSADGKCIANGGLDPRDDAQQCPQLWESTPGGAATLALGAALALTGGVMLGIDEVRVNGNRSTRATISWTIRF